MVATVSLLACTTTDKKSKEQKARDAFVKDSIATAKKMEIINDTASYTTIQWLDSTFTNLGKVKEGKQVDVAFRFKNTGSKPLIIISAAAGCGCTTPEKPEQPVPPGEEGVIKARFDSKGRKGDNRKYITIDANTRPSGSHKLEFEVIVE